LIEALFARRQAACTSEFRSTL
jgi:hypothetical protein